jgi:uncharacterized protein (TIGR02391 family)
MDTHERAKTIEELEGLIKEFKSYKRLYSKSDLTISQERYSESLRLRLQRRIGKAKNLVVQLTGLQYAAELNYKFDFWVEAVRTGGYTPRTIESIDDCIQACNVAIGKLDELEVQEIENAGAESPLKIFDAMKFHPRIIKASKSLFNSGHYAEAIFAAFKAVENFVQDKSGLTLYGTNLMERVFNEENPIIKVPEAGHYYKEVQKGFKHLFIGASQGIRNPKAHKEIIQKDPYITLHYLGFFSFLLKRIDYWEADVS